MNLTIKQQRFCDEYLISLNATQAAIKAGYSKKTARFIGQENLTKPDIQEYIQKRLAEKEDSLIAKQDEIMKALTRVLRREEQEYVVVTVKSRRSFTDDKGKKQTIEEERSEVVAIPTRVSDANKAAELLGKRYLMWTDKQQIDASVGVTIVDDLNE